MKKKTIIFNWKMNPLSGGQALALWKQYLVGLKKVDSQKFSVLVAPPFLYLPAIAAQKCSGPVALAGQNCFWGRQGAFTGEISPAMLKAAGAEFVLLGHSERRGVLGETNAQINQKVQAALKERLGVVLCVGEETAQREEKSGYLRLQAQLKESLQNVSATRLAGLILAYEPLWAISTTPGAAAQDTDGALSSILYLRKILGQTFSLKEAKKASILYGGSVNAKNIQQYVRQEGIDGVLVGGASLNGSEVLRILEQLN